MFTIVPMTETYANLICRWTYPTAYAMYDFDDSPEEREQLLNGLHFAALDAATGELLGFLALGWSAQVLCPATEPIYEDESYTDLALGLKPDLCGQGLGGALLTACIAFAKDLFPEDGVRLTADTSNLRAIKLYQQQGFHPIFDFQVEAAFGSAKPHPVKMSIYVLPDA